VLLAIIGLLPAIPHVILGIEHMFGKGNGPVKKQAATSAIADLVNVFAQLSGQSGAGANSPMMTFIDKLIEATVEMFNQDGTFTHNMISKGD
jgi:predicted TIM-barrel fold metal-dependent hydrolase